MNRRRKLVFAVIAAATLLVSHDAIFLVQLGPGEELARALRSAGHDYWGAASVAIAIGAVLAAVGVAHRLRRLSHHAAHLHAPTVRSPGLGRRSLRTWVALFVVVAIGFVLQENAEHLVVHAHPIGFGALAGPEYPLALPIIAFLTGIAADRRRAHRRRRTLTAGGDRRRPGIASSTGSPSAATEPGRRASVIGPLAHGCLPRTPGGSPHLIQPPHSAEDHPCSIASDAQASLPSC